jgi:hypothetical protein
VDSPQSSTLDRASLPTVLAYPEVFHLDDVPEIVGQFCYQIKGYALNGIAVVIRCGADVIIRIADWDGKPLSDDLKKYERQFLERYASAFVDLLTTARISQVELYISCDDSSMVLVDVRVAMDRMAGPGFVHDIFGKIMPHQEPIGSPVVITKEIAENLKQQVDRVIIKPSLFKSIARGTQIHALYARNWK